MRHCARFSFVLFAGLLALPSAAKASFHFMQVEQIIGGVNGDTTAQAIQLRMRFSFQNQVQNSRIFVRDANGANPILLATFPGAVPNSNAGDRVLIASANFSQYTSPGVVVNQTMTNLIPASYLAAGSLTFEDLFNTIYWRVSWGGAAYIGINTGSITNDSDGNFGPPVASALPSTSRQALKFTGASGALSTTNLADYAITGGAATFTNNAGSNFGVVTPTCVPCKGDQTNDLIVNGADIAKFASCFVNATPGIVGCVCTDFDNNLVLDAADITAFVDILLGNSAPSPPCT